MLTVLIVIILTIFLDLLMIYFPKTRQYRAYFLVLALYHCAFISFVNRFSGGDVF